MPPLPNAARLARLAALPALLAAGACVPLPGNRQLSRETVARKDGENTLVSDAGATCRVKADEFERVNVGDQHRCVWQYTDANASAASRGPGAGATGPVQDQAPRRAPGRPGGG